MEHVTTNQLLVEVHGDIGRAAVSRRGGLSAVKYLQRRVDEFMRGLNRTHGIFYREPNIMHSDGTCIEFALRRRENGTGRDEEKML